MTPLRHLGWLVILLMMATIACTTTVPPRELIERNDHAGLATWYEQEAIRLRGKAAEMRQMMQMYEEPSYQPSPKETKAQLIDHCLLYIESYTKAAEQADALAQLHRKQEKAIPRTTSVRSYDCNNALAAWLSYRDRLPIIGGWLHDRLIQTSSFLHLTVPTPTHIDGRDHQ